MEEAQRKHEDVLKINEMCKSIEKEENATECSEEKEDEEDEECDGEYHEEEDEDEEWSEGDEVDGGKDNDMDTAGGKTNNRPREDENDARPARRTRLGRNERSRSPPGEESGNAAA